MVDQRSQHSYIHTQSRIYTHGGAEMTTSLAPVTRVPFSIRALQFGGFRWYTVTPVVFFLFSFKLLNITYSTPPLLQLLHPHESDRLTAWIRKVAHLVCTVAHTCTCCVFFARFSTKVEYPCSPACGAFLLLIETNFLLYISTSFREKDPFRTIRSKTVLPKDMVHYGNKKLQLYFILLYL